MNREELIKKGLLFPVAFYMTLPENDARRVQYELKLIVLGIDPVRAIH